MSLPAVRQPAESYGCLLAAFAVAVAVGVIAAVVFAPVWLLGPGADNPPPASCPPACAASGCGQVPAAVEPGCQPGW